jgi:hypothetical protein
MPLSRDQILARQDDLPTADVPVPEWGDGESIRVRGLKSGERLQWALVQSKVSSGEADGPDPAALLLALAAVDDTGARLFQTQDVDALTELRGDVVQRVGEKVMALSGLTSEAQQEAEGKSDATPSGDSSTASPETSDAASPNSETGSPPQN